MMLISIVVVFIYAIFIVKLIVGNNKIKHISSPFKSVTPVTVIIALRNEVEHIEPLCTALFSQSYPQHNVEFIFVNDHSTDFTKELLEKHCGNSPFEYQIINLTDTFGKKAAISRGVELSKGEFILTTDADCTMHPEWINSMMNVAEMEQAEFLIGCVQMNKAMGWFRVFQQTEFAAIMACTSGSSAMSRPIACNGANLGFSKRIFQEIQPYKNNSFIASGDDVFFLHKAKEKNAKIKFVSNPQAIVSTKMSKTFGEYKNQRIRWAKKSRYFYDKDSIKFGLSILLIHLLFIAQLVGLIFNRDYFLALVVTFGLKFIFDTYLFYSARKWIGLNKLFWKSIVLSFLYPVYFLSFALLSLRSKTNWKGREV